MLRQLSSVICIILIFCSVVVVHRPAISADLTFEPNVYLYPASITLEGVYGPRYGRKGVSVATITEELLPGTPVHHVLSGPFHHDTSFALGSLAILEGIALAPPSALPNRPAVYQLNNGTIGIRNEQVVLGRHRRQKDVAVAIGAGPWLVRESVNYPFAETDPLYQCQRFNRHTYRCGVGLTLSGRFFTAAGYGTLEEFRDQVRLTLSSASGERVADMMNLDGGHTADSVHGSTVDVPLRLVILSHPSTQTK